MKKSELFCLIRDAAYKNVGIDVDYLVTTIDGTVYLLFQASTTREDWKTNLTYHRHKFDINDHTMHLHKGFGEAWESARVQIMDEFMAELQKTGGRPVIAGWSFGGAMAQLAAFDYHTRACKYATVITYGAPKVAADEKTKKEIATSGTFEQYANVNDCVPLMPPLPWFHHINKINVGGPFNLIELFKPQIYHISYSDPALYGEDE